MVNLGNGCFMRMHWRSGGGGRRGQMPQAAIFFGGRHFGEIVLLKQHSYIFIRCGLHEF